MAFAPQYRYYERFKPTNKSPIAPMATSSKDVRRMFGLSLHSWENSMVVFLIIAGGFALLAGVATWAVVRLQRIEIAESNLELERYKVDAGKALESTKAEASRANESSERLKNETARLQADNLALQKLMQPRRLGSTISFTSPDDPDVPPAAEIQFSGIRQFPKTPVLIQVVPDFEAQTLANDMAFVLGSYGWHVLIVDEATSHLSPRMIADGVQVTYTRDGKYADAAQALATGFTNAGLTGPAGWGLPQIFAQGQPVNPDGTPAESPMYPRFNRPVEAVVVLVGMKPIPPARVGDTKTVNPQ
jgi:hypothetical protein